MGGAIGGAVAGIPVRRRHEGRQRFAVVRRSGFFVLCQGPRIDVVDHVLLLPIQQTTSETNKNREGSGVRRIRLSGRRRQCNAYRSTLKQIEVADTSRLGRWYCDRI